MNTEEDMLELPDFVYTHLPEEPSEWDRDLYLSLKAGESEIINAPEDLDPAVKEERGLALFHLRFAGAIILYWIDRGEVPDLDKAMYRLDEYSYRDKLSLLHAESSRLEELSSGIEGMEVEVQGDIVDPEDPAEQSDPEKQKGFLSHLPDYAKRS